MLTYLGSSSPVISSFTPVNADHAPAPFNFINPLNTRHDRALDSDTFYGFKPNDAGSQYAAEMGQSSAIRTSCHRPPDAPLLPDHSIRSMSYQCQGPRAGEPPKKRLKSTYSKRSKSAKAPVSDRGENLDQEEIFVVEQDLLDGTELQLPSPPVTERHQSKVSVPTRAAKKGTKLGPFKNPVVTKPKIASKPEVQQNDDATTMRPVISSLGWTTTQEAVKLSKTTLDRLAAFRYTSFSNEEPTKSTKPGHVLVNQREQDMARLMYNSSDYNYFGHALSERQTSPAELRNLRDDLYPIQEQSQESPLQYAVLDHDNHNEENASIGQNARNSSECHDPIPNTSNIQNNATNDLIMSDVYHFIQHPIQGGPNTLDGLEIGKRFHNEVVEPLHPSGVNISEATYHSSSYGNPTSSEAKAMEAIIATALQAEALMSPEFQQSSNYDNPTSSEARVMELLSPALIISQEVVHISNACSSTNLVHAHQGEDPGCVNIIQSQNQPSQSQLQNEPETTCELPHTTRDSDMDDFDDGIDDDDLLGLENTSMGQPVEYVPREGHEQILKDNLAKHSQKVLEERRAHNHPRPILQEHEDILPPHDTKPEPDDEYPLEESEEEDMLNLQGVVEHCKVPTSLNYGEHEDSTSGEVYDRSLQYSPPTSRASMSPKKAVRLPPTDQTSDHSAALPEKRSDTNVFGDGEEVDWSFIRSNDSRSTAPRSAIRSQTRTPAKSPSKSQRSRLSATQVIDDNLTKRKKHYQIQVGDPVQVAKYAYILDDSQEYEPLPPFARPDFPILLRDRSPIVGLSTQTFLRVCFRVGELFKEGGRCDALNQNAVIELFARVTFSSREPGTTNQHFHFADLWHDRPPYPTGVLANYKSSGLAETESKVFVGAPEGIMARCFGTLRRQTKGTGGGWLLHIVSIRETDWEEIRWTKRIVSAGLVKTERANL